MSETLKELEQQALQQISLLSSLPDLEQIRVHYLGKKGLLTEQLKQTGQLPPEQRLQFGQLVNQTKEVVQQAIEARKETLQAQQLQAQYDLVSLLIPIVGFFKGDLVKVGKPKLDGRSKHSWSNHKFPDLKAVVVTLPVYK